jgi:hypothetical protein
VSWGRRLRLGFFKTVIAALVAAIHRSTSAVQQYSSTLVDGWITATSAVMTNLGAVLRLPGLLRLWPDDNMET